MWKSILFVLTLIPVSVIAQQNKGLQPVSSSVTSSGGETFAVVVGISDYQDPGIPDLRFADRDALAFADFLRSPAGGSLDEDHLLVLINNEATMAQYAIALDWMWEKVQEGDKAIIYFSGHGDVERKSLTQPGFLLCWDAPAQVYMSGGAFALGMLQEVISTLSVQNKAEVLVVTDACRSGKLSGSSINGSQITGNNLARQYANETKILSCQPEEYSLEGEQWGGGRGAFSYHLIDALYGLADRNQDNTVNLMEIERYLEDHVTAEVAPNSQVPMVVGPKTKPVTNVIPELKEKVQQEREGNLKVFAATESRGIEAKILGSVDTITRQDYETLKQLLRDKVFFADQAGEAENDFAEYYFQKLEKEASLAGLHSTMRRNYAAALQDDAQQAINAWVKADIKMINCIGTSIPLDPIPRMLERAAELLGPDHYMYNFLKARQYLFQAILDKKHGHPDEALGRKVLALLQKAILLEPESPLPWHRMAMVYYENLRMKDSALICAEKARAIAPNWVLPYTDLCYSALNLHDPELAKTALDRAILIDPEHPYVLSRKGALYYYEENYEKALEAFERYDEAGAPKFPCWHNDFALLLKDMGRIPEAEAEFKRGLAYDSTSISLRGNLAVLHRDVGRLDLAISMFKQVLEDDSLAQASWYNLGLAYKFAGEVGKAEAAVKKAITIDSLNLINWSLLGDIYWMTNRLDSSLWVYNNILKKDSFFIEAYAPIGRVYLQQNDLKKAEAIYLEGLKRAPGNAHFRNQIGYIYIRFQRYDEAEHIFRQLLSEDPTEPLYLNNLGQIYGTTGRFEESEKYFREALRVAPNFVASYSNFARLKTEQKDWQEAAELYQKAIDLQPENAFHYLNLGSTFIKAEELENAKAAFERAEAINANSLWPHLGYAIIALKREDTKEAVDHLEKAIQKGATRSLLESREDLSEFRKTEDWVIIAGKYFSN